MASTLAPTPEFVVERPVRQQSITGRVTQAMRYWLLSLADRINRTPEVRQTVTLTGQSASIAATTISVLSLPEGVYRLSAAARVTTVWVDPGGGVYVVQRGGHREYDGDDGQFFSGSARR